MKVRVLFFAGLRDRVGNRELPYDLPADSTIQDLLEVIRGAHPGVTDQLPVLRYAVGEEYVPAEHPLKDGDVVALIPPVSGG